MATTYIVKIADFNGRTVSTHRNLACAVRKSRAIQPGERGSYVPTEIFAIENGVARNLDTAEHDAKMFYENLCAQGVL